jgi:Arc/MetJ-type ribon-helix-helix transcriptional regulator
MKERVSATIEEDVIEIIDSIVKKGDFRNRSHFIEKAIRKFAEEELKKKN